MVCLAATNMGVFTYDFDFAVVGSIEFELKHQRTYCESKANANRGNGDNPYDTDFHYKIALDENGWLNPDYDGAYKVADGTTQFTYYNKYNKIKANTYTVNVDTNDCLTCAGIRIKGVGTLCQY